MSSRVVQLRTLVAVSGLILLAGLLDVAVGQDRRLDRFNYDTTKIYNNRIDFGPKEWIRVRCEGQDKSKCTGWPDAWEYANGWEVVDNHCDWCPDNRCGEHHQSPIDLRRDRAVRGSTNYNECIDVHWMAYRDSSCSFDSLRKARSFQIDRHALRILQPIREEEDGRFTVNCPSDKGRFWGRIDFSRGFSAWWFLSHMDFHVPSEHTQEGKRYDGEIQMYHFYSKTGEEAGIDNEMAAVTVFLEAYDEAEDYDMLNRVICAWREEEELTRRECNLGSVRTEYPGCFRYNSKVDPNHRNLRTNEQTKPPLSAHDIFLQNHYERRANASSVPVSHNPVDDFFEDDGFDWEAFIASQYKDDVFTKGKRSNSSSTIGQQGRRHLINYEHVEPWHNYFPMLGVRTEYYYRYSGSQTVPPCYGRYFRNSNRKQTNHYRIMKDPIRISRRQIIELNRLLRERIAPIDDPVVPCRPDTAAKIDPTSTWRVSTARPLQSNHKVHYKVFCECGDWKSKWQEDQEWCRIRDQKERFYRQPYNFPRMAFESARLFQ